LYAEVVTCTSTYKEQYTLHPMPRTGFEHATSLVESSKTKQMCLRWWGHPDSIL